MQILKTYTVFYSPTDFPQQYVIREFHVSAGTIIPKDIIAIGNSIDEVRAKLPQGLLRIIKSECDLPSIVEMWI